MKTKIIQNMIAEFPKNTETQNSENRVNAYKLLTNEIETVLFSIGIVKNPDDIIDDPLTDVSRKGKKMLLITSTISIIILIFNLFPQKLSLSGIEFGHIEKSNLLILLAISNSYFLFSFWFYGSIDYHKWRLKIIERAKINTNFLPNLDANANLNQIRLEFERLYKWQEENEQKKNDLYKWKKYENIRKVIDYYFPIFYSSFALLFCIFHFIMFRFINI